jgi:hypothetical protein
MHGFPGTWFPVWMNVMVGSWLIASVWSVRKTQMSSVIPAVRERR